MSLQEFYRGNHALLLYISTDDRTADGFRYHTTVPERAAYRSSVLTPLTSFNSSQKTTSLISLTSPFAKIE